MTTPEAPKERLVEQHSGSVAPTSMAGALVLCEHLASERDKAVKEKVEARAEVALLAGLLQSSNANAHRLATELAHALADRDEFRVRFEELEDEVARLVEKNATLVRHNVDLINEAEQ